MAQGAAYARLLEETPRIAQALVEPSRDTLGQAIRELERHIGADRWTLQRLRVGSYEARTFEGDVGRGDTATDALVELLGVLRGTAQTTPAALGLAS